MPVIQKLDNNTINKIAAGEVIERPSSIVKELVENSIDAEASAITIEIENGGISLIRVTDNGIGMDREDAEISFQRHATSKISSVDDINNLHTLGFRGEALASIAAVTQVEMLTRQRGQISGCQIVNHGGELKKISEVGCPEGTTIIVRNLFYNTPARLKFLRSPRSETAAISDLTAKLILANPQISIKLISNGKIIYHSPGNGILLNAIASIYGNEIINQLIKIEEQPDDSLTLYGYIGKPSLNRANRAHQSFFVNKRYINCPLLSECLEEALKEQTMVNRFPWCVLNVNLPAQEVDVNVHPSKTEIRFHNPIRIKQMLTNAFKNATINRQNIPKMFSNFDYERKDIKKKTISDIVTVEDNILNNKFAAGNTPIKKMFIQEEIREEGFSDYSINENENENTIDSYKFTKFNVIGSAFSTFILVESDKELYIIDQHAAHERLIYEQLKDSVNNQKVCSQQLLPPYILEVTHEEYISISDNLSEFITVGFEIESFGSNAFIVRGVPTLLREANIRELFNELLDHIDKNNKKLVLLKDDIIKISCKKAVKAHDKLSKQEIKELLKKMEQKSIPLTCPHGRPILISISRYELEKRFKRIQ